MLATREDGSERRRQEVSIVVIDNTKTKADQNSKNTHQLSEKRNLSGKSHQGHRACCGLWFRSYRDVAGLFYCFEVWGKAETSGQDDCGTRKLPVLR